MKSERTRDMLTITHTHEEGTLIEGTSKGDGSAAALKEQRWRWSRALGAWYVPHSRDQRPKHHVIRATVAALEAAGFQVATDLDEGTRSPAEVEAAKTARQDDRAAALADKADRKTAAADAAWSAHLRDAERLPEGGEPIKIGHHSEGRHRRAIERSWQSLGRSVEASDAAEEAKRRATVAAATNGARYSPVTVANRIEKLQADERRAQRAVVADVYDSATGYRPATEAERAARAKRYAPQLEELHEQIEFWQGVRADQIASGQVTDYGKHNVSPGDGVKVRGSWYIVTKTNAKTVVLDVERGMSNKAPWAEVQKHCPAAEIAAAKARA